MVMNTGTIITEAVLTGAVGSSVVWNVLENSREYMERTFGKAVKPVAKKRLLCWRKGQKGRKTPPEGTPPPAPAHVKGRAAFMVHGSATLSFEVRRCASFSRVGFVGSSTNVCQSASLLRRLNLVAQKTKKGVFDRFLKKSNQNGSRRVGSKMVTDSIKIAGAIVSIFQPQLLRTPEYRSWSL